MSNTIPSKDKLDKFFEKCHQFEDKILDKRKELVELLMQYETHATAEDEIERSLSAIRGLRTEFSHIKKPLSDLTISTFFPLNLPLYSLVLFGIIPSAFAKNVFIRPPEVMHDILNEIWSSLEIEDFFPVVSIHSTPRTIFLELFAKNCDVIIFTGKYENALTIHKSCPNALLLYNGSGVNPFIICKNADVMLAAKKAVEMRCFNSGQDCAGPDAFFVPSSLSDQFITALRHEIETTINVGDSRDPKNNVSKTIKTQYIDEIKDWLVAHSGQVIYGGEIDETNDFVHPTIIKRILTTTDDEQFHEFFAPMFYVLVYENNEILTKLLQTKPFTERGMYTSVFGSDDQIEQALTTVRILRNQIVNDVEQGNKAYGGYGPKANFVLWKGQFEIRPILLSEEIHNKLTNEKKK